MNKLVSIIVPIYNIDKYLPTCIDSILNQTLQNLEIILVDDGSTDSSAEICEKYSEIDTRVKVIHKANSGLSAARNTGLSASKGEYVIFIDGDDYLHPQMIETLYALLEENKECSFSMVQGTTSKSQVIDFPETNDENEIIDSVTFQERLFCTSSGLTRTNYFVVWNKLYKKADISDIEFRKTQFEDLVFNIEICEKTSKCIICSKILYNYLIRNNSLARSKNFHSNEETISSFELCLKIINPEHEKVKAHCLDMLYKRLFSMRYNLGNEKMYMDLYKEKAHLYLPQITTNKYLRKREQAKLLLLHHCSLIYSLIITTAEFIANVKSVITPKNDKYQFRK